MRVCAIIPCYNHGDKLHNVVSALKNLHLPVIVVDDASDAKTANTLDELAATQPDSVLRLLRHPENRGKGGAVISGMREAERLGFSHVLQIDADGQHDVAAVPALLEAAAATPDDIISGRPVYDASAPASRRYGRQITQVWVYIETLSFDLRDVMCGFRIYPLRAAFAAIANKRVGKRMDFDTEILVRAFWLGTRTRFVPVKITYPEDGVSHFHPFLDNARISWMHTRLVCSMLPYLLRRLSGNWSRTRSQTQQTAETKQTAETRG